MNIESKELKQSIKSLVKGQSVEEILDLLMNEMTDIQLQNVIQIALDPEYHSKQAALTDPKRFMSKGELAEVRKSSVDVKVSPEILNV